MIIEKHRDIRVWMSGTVDELEIDAVGLWQIVFTLKNRFGVTGDSLSQFVRETVLILLAAGARPVTSSSDLAGGWAFRLDFGLESEQVADKVVADWLALGRDPDVGDVWFATPKLTLLNQNETQHPSRPLES